jgi:hypothetical protein
LVATLFDYNDDESLVIILIMMSFDYELLELCVDANFLMLKKKNYLLCFAFPSRNGGVVKYGIRAGSTP